MDRRRSDQAANTCYAVKIFLALLLQTELSFAQGNIRDQYVGCYHDAVSQWTWTTGIANSNQLTIELCIGTCASLNTTYVILQGGDNCMCGDIIDTSQQGSDCNAPCSGNASEDCGGSGKTSQHYIVYTVCPIGFFGINCNQVCHCKDQIPCNRLTGICPNGCDGNWTGDNCSAEAAYTDRYLGCYRDSSARAMSKWLGPFSNPNPILYCSTQCALLGYTYAGLQAGAYGFCGEQYDRYGETAENSCNSLCIGNSRQTCGGPWLNSVYSVCPTGSFGPNCTSQCHCNRTSEICPYRSGTCKSGCKPGWSGISCSLRDCSVENGDCNENETCTTVALNYAIVTRCQCSRGYYRANLWESCRVSTEKEVGIIVGSVVGSVVGLALIIAVVYLGFHFHRKKCRHDLTLHKPTSDELPVRERSKTNSRSCKHESETTVSGGDAVRHQLKINKNLKKGVSGETDYTKLNNARSQSEHNYQELNIPGLRSNTRTTTTDYQNRSECVDYEDFE